VTNECHSVDTLVVLYGLFHNREEKQKERDAEARERWLQERQEKKIELERAWKPPGMWHPNFAGGTWKLNFTLPLPLQ